MSDTQPNRHNTSIVLPRMSDHRRLLNILTNAHIVYGKYKYTVYRCASKFAHLQHSFCTTRVPYRLVLAVLERHGLNVSGDVMVPPFQLTALIHDIYYACEAVGHFNKVPDYNTATATGVLANFLWDIFDPHRHHSISLLEIKVIFLLLCKLHDSDQLVVECFKLLYDPRKACVTRRNFEYFLSILTKIFTFIGEGNAYGDHNSAEVLEQCFSRGATRLDEYQFHCLWTATQTRFLIYANLIALIKRIEDTRKLVHSNACAGCAMEHITGIRFRCQQCPSVSLCMKCFALGYASGKHSPRHRMFEMFTEDPAPKKMTNFFARICQLFSPSKRNAYEASEEKKEFCDSSEVVGESETPAHSSPTSNASSAVTAIVSGNNTIDGYEHDIEISIAGLSTTASNVTNVSERLQQIIDRLILQNARVENQIKYIKDATTEEISQFLNAHHSFLLDIIKEMRRFANISQSLSSYPTSSTPHRSSDSNVLNSISSTPPTVTSCEVAVVANSSTLTHSINGADVNRSYLDANKSDFSLKDISTWFSQAKAARSDKVRPELPCHGEDVIDVRDTDMTNFKLLLNKVKEIVEDSFSENTELAEATQNLENVVDNIVNSEEQRRQQM